MFPDRQEYLDLTFTVQTARKERRFRKILRRDEIHSDLDRMLEFACEELRLHAKKDWPATVLQDSRNEENVTK